jgi:porphobilinogen synthase
MNLIHRLRRLRRTEALRTLVRETLLTPDDFVYPLFVCEGEGVRREIGSMPGCYNLSIDELVREAESVVKAGVRSVMLFGKPDKKDAAGTGSYSEDGITQRAIRALRREVRGLVLAADNCLCEYTDHSHCGLVGGGEVCNDRTLELLARAAVSQAEAGADIIAPSSMMDGSVAAIRTALDTAGFEQVAIMPAAVYASALYDPYCEAAESMPQFGDRRGYQMDPANLREGLREAALDLDQGADILMIKPAMPYLDIIRAVRERFDVPVAAHQVSGEYAMIKAAARMGWIDEHRVIIESLTAIKRAGASLILTYFACDVARRIA